MDYQDLKPDTSVRLFEYVGGNDIKVTVTADGDVRCSSRDVEIDDEMKQRFLQASEAAMGRKITQDRDGVVSAITFNVIVRDELWIVIDSVLTDGTGDYFVDRLMTNHMSANGGLKCLEPKASGLWKFVRMMVQPEYHYSSLQTMRGHFDPDPFMADGYAVEMDVFSGNEKRGTVLLQSPFQGMRQSDVESVDRLHSWGRHFIDHVNENKDLVSDAIGQYKNPATQQVDVSKMDDIAAHAMEVLMDDADEKGIDFDEEDDVFLFILKVTVTNIIRAELSNAASLVFGAIEK